MLIQITNRCRMGCPHCLEASTPDGGLMDEATIGNALKLAEMRLDEGSKNERHKT